MWTGPIEITIDELFIVLGPNIEKFMSQDDSYVRDGDQSNNEGRKCDKLLEPYDQTNMYNIFEN